MLERTSATATTETVSAINLTAIVHALRQHGPLSRVRIGQVTGLSQATVNRLTNQLLDRKLIVKDGEEPSGGGRRAVIYRFTGGPRAIMSIALGPANVVGGLVDLDGRLVHRAEASVRLEDDGPGHMAATLAAAVRLMTATEGTASTLGLSIEHLAVSVPGIVTQPGGNLAAFPELGLRPMSLQKFFARHVRCPITIENDANALAVGEYRRGVGQGTSSLVALVRPYGLGAGIIIGGRLHHGKNFEAGEIGHLIVDRSSLNRTFSRTGDLESRIGAAALRRAAVDLGIPIAPEDLLDTALLSRLAAAPSEAAGALFREVVDYIAMAVAALATIIDPEIIVLGRGFDAARVDVAAAVSDRLQGRIHCVPRIVHSELGDDAVLVGAAELAADRIGLIR